MQVNQTDSVGIFLKEMAKYPLLTHEEELLTANTYKKYQEINLVRKIVSNPVNSTLMRYNQLVNLRESQSLEHRRKISLDEWAIAASMTTHNLKNALIDGRSQWAILANMEVETIVKIEADGLKARDLLMKSNIRLVVSIAKKYLNRGLEYLDLIQEGMIGMDRAIEKFDVTRGYRFSTYAYQWIRQAITRAISSLGREIRVPAHTLEKLSAIKKAQKILLLAGEEASIPAIAKTIGQSVKQINFTLQSTKKVASLDKNIGKEEASAWVEIIPSPLKTPEELLEENLLLETIPRILSQLNTKERQVITLRYGFIGENTTLASIGAVMNISRERVRQIEVDAMRKMRAGAHKYQDARELLVQR